MPDLLFYPVFDEAEALAGVSDGEVVHPAAQHRIDQLDHPAHGLGLVRFPAPPISRRDG